MEQEYFELVDTPKPINESIIKVVGVGGCGNRAVYHMYEKGIKDVTFANCNTDRQDLDKFEGPDRVQIGKEGLGAGGDPVKAKEIADNDRERIREMLNDGTKMIFITAGMGGGTGTGAGPIIAQVAREMGILTVGIVTIPFILEGIPKIKQALEGLRILFEEVDSLIVLSNQKLLEMNYQGEDIPKSQMYDIVNDQIATAAKSIAELITVTGEENIDFNDVQRVFKDGGISLISAGETDEKENRINKSIDAALNSPLLNNNDMRKAKALIFHCTSTQDNEITSRDMQDITKFTNSLRRDIFIKQGSTYQDDMNKTLRVTILASGFGIDNLPFLPPELQEEISEDERKKRKEEEEKWEKDIRTVYGEVYFRNQNRNFYIMEEDELDDDIVIANLMETPPYSRSTAKLNEMKDARASKKQSIKEKKKEVIKNTGISF